MPPPAADQRVRVPRRRVSVGALRDAARGAVARTSLRQVARDVGMSAPGLALFLDGSMPRESTLEKIRTWYFSEAASRSDTSHHTARAAIELLLEPMPSQETRERVYGEILGVLTRPYRRKGIVPPLWLRELAATAAVDDEPNTTEEHEPPDR